MTSPILLEDPERLRDAARDFGDIVHETPRYVAQPRSTEEVAELVRLARRRGLSVAARGVGHSAGGQAQAPGGLVLDMRGLDAFHGVDGEIFEADAGLAWRGLMAELLPRGLAPPVVTDWLEPTLGGTLSAGGVGAQSFRHGLQADEAVSLTVVDGRGEILECSAEQNPELFEAIRGGQGQYAIVTRARMRVGPAPARALLDHLVFDDAERFVTAVEALMDRPRVEGLLAHAVPNDPEELARSLRRPPAQLPAIASEARWLYDLELLRYCPAEEAGAPTELAAELGALEAVATREESSFSAFVNRVPPAVERDRRVGRAPHPELTIFVPHEHAAAYLSATMEHLQVPDLGGGPVLLIPLRPPRVRSPYVRMPASERAWLIGILRAAPSPEHVEPMQRDNLELWRRGTRVGGLRYLVDSLTEPANAAAWAAHFGPVWARARAVKQRHDPEGLFAPRLGIFAS